MLNFMQIPLKYVKENTFQYGTITQDGAIKT